MNTQELEKERREWVAMFFNTFLERIDYGQVAHHGLSSVKVMVEAADLCATYMQEVLARSDQTALVKEQVSEFPVKDEGKKWFNKDRS